MQGDAPAKTPRGVAAAVGPLLRDPRLGRSVGVTIRDGATGRQHLLDQTADRPRTPASATKLLTAAAVTAQLGDERTFTTKAVVRGAEVYLVAGGDTLLAPGRGSLVVAGRAGLGDLARQAAAQLTTRGLRAVTLRLDDRHAAGPRLAPSWSPADVAFGLTGPVTSLGLSTQRPARTPGS